MKKEKVFEENYKLRKENEGLKKVNAHLMQTLDKKEQAIKDIVQQMRAEKVAVINSLHKCFSYIEKKYEVGE